PPEQPAQRPRHTPANTRGGPAPCDQPGRASQTECDERPRNRRRRRCAEHGNGRRRWCIPSRVAEQRACTRVVRARAEASQRLTSAERVEEFGGLALILLVGN